MNEFNKKFFQFLRFAILSSVKIHVLPCLAHIQEMHSMKILQDYQMTRLLRQDWLHWQKYKIMSSLWKKSFSEDIWMWFFHNMLQWNQSIKMYIITKKEKQIIVFHLIIFYIIVLLYNIWYSHYVNNIASVYILKK